MKVKNSILIDIDDVHPETSSMGTDCSGDMDQGVFKYLNKLVDEFPEIKITLFVVPDWLYKPQLLPFKVLPIYLKKWNHEFQIDKHKEWCNWLREKVKSGKFEVGVHGLHHFQGKRPFSAEFQNLSYGECEKRISQAEKLLEKCDIPFVKAFRPPGWIGSKFLMSVLQKRKYLVTGSVGTQDEISDDSTTSGPGLKTNLLYLEKLNGIYNVPVNCDIKKSNFERIEQIIRLNGLVVLHGHIENDYHGEKIYNGVDKESYDNLKNILKLIFDKIPDVNFPGFSGIYNSLL